MNQDLDKSKMPSTSYRETFSRHRKLLCLPVILGALAAAFFLFGTAKTYKSTASLWVDTAPPTPSSVGANATSMSEPPAAAEQAILGELLTTRSFAASVVQAASGKSSGGGDSSGETATKLVGAGQVSSAATGGQVLQISYSASSPAMAEAVLGALVTQLRDYTNRLAAQHAQATLAYDRAQAKVAQTALATARSSISAYQAQHPQANLSDPNYASLVAAENNATTQLSQANTALSQAGTGSGWSSHISDRRDRSRASLFEHSPQLELDKCQKPPCPLTHSSRLSATRRDISAEPSRRSWHRRIRRRSG